MKTHHLKTLLYTFCASVWVLIVATPLYPMVNFDQLTDMGGSAKLIRLGNVEGWSQSAEGLFENPAALNRVTSISVSAFHTTLFNQVDMYQYAAAYRSPWGVFSAGLFGASVDGFQETEKVLGQLQETRQFDYRDQLWKLGYSNSLNAWIHYGMSLSYIDRQFTLDSYKGSGANIDSGLLITGFPVQISMTWKNMVGNRVVYQHSSTATEYLPHQFVLSGKYTSGHSDYFAQINFVGNQDIPLMNLAYQMRPLESLSFSFGYKEFFVVQSVERGMAFGMGLNLSPIHLNYAYEVSEYVGHDADHYFSFSIDLGHHPNQKSNKKIKTTERDAYQDLMKNKVSYKEFYGQ